MKLTGRRIRNIRVERQLGRGGMGRVYLGFDEALQRRVALKVIRSSRRLDPENKARFLREARVLSALEHPGICRIYDYVDDDPGLGEREILVLEYVEGRTLAELMEQGVDERTKFSLVTQLAEALAAAHAAGIIHRDLKPDNVMWTPTGRLKVLDFGLARGLDDPVQVPAKWGQGDEAEFGTVPVAWQPVDAGSAAEDSRPDEESGDTVVDDSLAGDTLAGDTLADDTLADDTLDGSFGYTSSGTAVTELGSIVGTVAYMSPEQAQGLPLTTASDMYSFGILCQELFTGRGVYPEEPSYLVRLKNVALAETVPPTGVDRELADLVGRLLSKVPDARPRAADALERIERIRDRPRRRLRRLIAVLLTLALLAAGAKYTLDLRREQARTEAALVQAERARTEAQRVTDFLVDVFEVSDPGEARGNQVTAREVLDRGVERIDAELSGEPRIQAKLLLTMASVYHQLGLYGEARGLAERSLSLARRLVERHGEGRAPDDDLVLLAACLLRLGDTYFFLDRYDEAAQLVQDSLDLRRQVHGPEHVSVAQAEEKLGKLRYDLGDLDGSRRHLETALEIMRSPTAETGGREDIVGTITSGLADVAADQGDYGRADQLYRQALEILERTVGPNHPAMASLLDNLAQVYLVQGRNGEAADLVRRSLALRQEIYGDRGHPTLGISYSLLGSAAQEQGRLEEARDHLQAGYEVFRRHLEPNHFNIGANRLLVGVLNLDLEAWDDAEGAFQQSLEVWSESGLEQNYNALATREGLARVAFGRGAYGEALDGFRAVEALWRERLGESTIETLTARLEAGRCLRRLGRLDEAEREIRQVRPQLEELNRSESSPESTEVLAKLHLLAGRVAEDRADVQRAREAFETAMSLVRQIPSHDEQPSLVALRAQFLLRLGRNDEAEPLLTRLQERDWRDSELWRLADARVSSGRR